MHNSQAIGTADAHTHNGILFSHKEEGKFVICRQIDRSREHHVKWSALSYVEDISKYKCKHYHIYIYIYDMHMTYIYVHNSGTVKGDWGRRERRREW
jgi:hypothetical protein